MRTPEDVLRSLKRYAWQIVGDEYEVRLEDEEGTFKRPAVLVASASPNNISTGRWVKDNVMAYTLYVYPPTATRTEDARLNAARVEDLFYTGFATGVGEGAPDRVPLWDYTGVPTTESVIGRFPHDFARVSDLSIEPRPDPGDRTMWTVLVNVRLSWRRSAGTVYEGRPVTTTQIRPA